MPIDEKYIEFLKEKREFLLNWRDYLGKIKQAVKELLPDAEVFVFGSILKEWYGGSDVDILVVSNLIPEKLTERSEMKVDIYEKAGLPFYHPFEIHLVNEKEQEWYKRHIDKIQKI